MIILVVVNWVYILGIFKLNYYNFMYYFCFYVVGGFDIWMWKKIVFYLKNIYLKK